MNLSSGLFAAALLAGACSKASGPEGERADQRLADHAKDVTKRMSELLDRRTKLQQEWLAARPEVDKARDPAARQAAEDKLASIQKRIDELDAEAHKLQATEPADLRSTDQAAEELVRSKAARTDTSAGAP